MNPVSGAGIFGIAAAVLQIADLGTRRVPVELFGFARKVRRAAEKSDLVSKDIAATGGLRRRGAFSYVCSVRFVGREFTKIFDC